MELKLEDLVEGEYYETIDNFEKPAVFICGKSKDKVYKYWVSTVFENEISTFSGVIILNNLKPASKKSIHWLNTCIKDNKFIPLSEIKEEPINILSKLELW